MSLSRLAVIAMLALTSLAGPALAAGGVGGG